MGSSRTVNLLPKRWTKVKVGGQSISLPADPGRQRDLFPIPKLPEVKVEVGSILSRGCKQRLLRKARRVKQANEAIDALNQLYASHIVPDTASTADSLLWQGDLHRSPSSRPSSRGPNRVVTAVQREAQQCIFVGCCTRIP